MPELGYTFLRHKATDHPIGSTYERREMISSGPGPIAFTGRLQQKQDLRILSYNSVVLVYGARRKRGSKKGSKRAAIVLLPYYSTPPRVLTVSKYV